MGEDKIRIALIEDHEEFRSSLQFLLSTNGKFDCRSFGKAEDALENFKTGAPDIVIMDINLPGISGIECTRIIHETYRETMVMMCTVYEDDEKIFDALKAGASGYLLKRAAINDIFDAVLSLYGGGSPMSAVIARKVVASFQQPAHPELSSRENEILNLLSEGFRIKEIADKLFISLNTVRTHIRHIYEKLHVQSRVEALNKAGKKRF